MIGSLFSIWFMTNLTIYDAIFVENLINEDGLE